MVDTAQITQIAQWLREARQIVILTGAGISTESGIPDFRGPQGLWTKDPSTEKYADIRYFKSDPEIRRRSWQNRLSSGMWDAEPNAGHRAIAELESKAALHTIVTQNVDGLHQAAGSSPEKVIEIHGTIREVMCLTCAWREAIGPTLERIRSGDDDPACNKCGGILKSATISFGQNLVAADLQRAEEASAGADVFLALGTSLAVYPAAALPGLAVGRGARLMIINEQPTPYDSVGSIVVREPLGEVLPAIVALV